MITEEQQNLTKRNRWDIKYQILHNEWTELDCSCEVTPEELQEHLMVAHQNQVPVNRKGQSAMVFSSAMYIYGGYIDMIGSSQEFWKLDFDTKLWTLLDCIQMEVGPGPRHSHSAMTVLDCMYLFGGLREQRDLWRWNSTCHSWSCLKAMSGPSL
ncbi:kelch domain-containing protein 3 isoform X2 [Oncorhynchus mykiss]|uniref:kelch domain-containing protein 3 isoform X2 n=1 Tax=Oncorhynchus mykiss TaxID=8022 RepID=UPI000B4F6546|nr:kelch domain-containing protein 3 isoform X2 [Oncorhynchus mykiss]